MAAQVRRLERHADPLGEPGDQVRLLGAHLDRMAHLDAVDPVRGRGLSDQNGAVAAGQAARLRPAAQPPAGAEADGHERERGGGAGEPGKRPAGASPARRHEQPLGNGLASGLGEGGAQRLVLPAIGRQPGGLVRVFGEVGLDRREARRVQPAVHVGLKVLLGDLLRSGGHFTLRSDAFGSGASPFMA